jgi:hypothetical protein
MRREEEETDERLGRRIEEALCGDKLRQKNLPSYYPPPNFPPPKFRTAEGGFFTTFLLLPLDCFLLLLSMVLLRLSPPLEVKGRRKVVCV